ncbi:MAG: hypothetical protein JO214_01425 [Frankiaceae bacterium]|nr:hypothetical protein [Frankiaceae bacterium]
MSRTAAAGLAMTAALTLAAGCGGSSSKGTSAAGSGKQLIGLFRLTPGAAHGKQLTGTWFRMLQPKGDVATGPYMVNGDSPADGGRATLLTPGTSGGLRTNAYQSQPAPAFDSRGNSLADSITKPTKFFGVQFSISTNEVDLQTKTKVAPPTVVDNNGRLTANLASWAASWNKQNFNQGAPKPVSSTGAQAPGQQEATRVFDWVSHKYLNGAPKPSVSGTGATGTYNASTGAFVLQWTSLIVDGPFAGFTGIWHLEGTFQPGSAGPSGQ